MICPAFLSSQLVYLGLVDYLTGYKKHAAEDLSAGLSRDVWGMV